MEKTAGKQELGRILLVEDEKIIAFTIKRMLEAMGYQVSAILSSGTEAVAFCSSETPDLIIMDILLAGPMDGITAAETIMQTKNIPVIYLSANADTEAVARARVTEPYGYLNKPAGERDLYNALEAAKSRKLAEQKLRENILELEKRILKLESGNLELQKAKEGLQRNEDLLKQAEEVSREKDLRVRSIFQAAPVGIGLVFNRILKEVNGKFCDIVGYTEEELIDKSARILYTDDEEFERVGREKYKQIEQYGTGSVETHWRHRDGRIIDIILSSTPMDPDNLSKGVTFVALDITDRKKAEKEILRHHEFLDTLLNTIPNPVFYKSVDGTIRGCNLSMERFFGKDKEDLIGKSFSELTPLEAAENAALSDTLLMENLVPHRYEGRLSVKDGEIRDVIISKAVYSDDRNEIAGIVGIITDITEQKTMEKAQKDSIKEKETLLKEIHHRVKNNMQVIISLLNLQSQQHRYKGLEDAFFECGRRIRSMARIHELLYQSENLTRIDFHRYLENMVNDLKTMYTPPEKEMDVRFDGPTVYLSINNAIPLGLIANELISNGFKHAFPPDFEGQRRLKLDFQENSGILTLSVSDSGVGLPKDFNIEASNTLGMILVNQLVNQLDGTLEIDRDEGTCFKVRVRE